MSLELSRIPSAITMLLSHRHVRSIRFAAVAGLLLVFSLPARAALVPVDSPFGADTLTQDTETGLLWLDVTESTMYSYDEVVSNLGPGGQFEGYRLATADEVVELWQHAGIDTSTNEFVPQNLAPVTALMNLVGKGATNGNLGDENLFDFTAGHIYTPGEPETSGWVIVATIAADPDDTHTGRVDFGTVPSDNDNNDHGAWLVADSLLGTGLRSGQVALTYGQLTFDEADGFMPIEVRRLRGDVGQVSVLLSTSDGTAIAGTNYGAVSQLFTWQDGDSSPRVVKVPLIDDPAPGGGVVNFRLSDPGGNPADFVILRDHAIGIIHEDQVDASGIVFSGVVDAASYDVRVPETAGSVTLYVDRRFSSAGMVSVKYNLVPISATAGVDFVATSGVLTWADGDTAPKEVTLTILDDADVEATEQVRLFLTNVSANAYIAPFDNVIDILDDEIIGQSDVIHDASSSPRYLEFETGADGAAVRLVRTGDGVGEVTATVSFNYGGDRSATPGIDYEDTTLDFVWADGETGVKVQPMPILDDNYLDNTDVFEVIGTTIKVSPGVIKADSVDPSLIIIDAEDQDRVTDSDGDGSPDLIDLDDNNNLVLDFLEANRKPFPTGTQTFFVKENAVLEGRLTYFDPDILDPVSVRKIDVATRPMPASGQLDGLFGDRFPDGRFTYTPGSGFVGTDSFAYALCDREECAGPFIATIVVEPTELSFASPLPDITVPEDTDYIVVNVGDAFGDEFTSVVFGGSSNPDLFGYPSVVDGLLTLPIIPDAFGEATVSVGARQQVLSPITYVTTLNLKTPVSNPDGIDRIVFTWNSTRTSGAVSQNDITGLTMELWAGETLVYEDVALAGGVVQPIGGNSRDPIAPPGDQPDPFWDYDLDTLTLHQMRNVLDVKLPGSAGTQFSIADGLSLPADGNVWISRFENGDSTATTLEQLESQSTSASSVTPGSLKEGFTTFRVTVTPVEDAPTLVNPIADFRVLEDNGAMVLDLSVVFEDIDTTPEQMTYTATAADGTLISTSFDPDNPARLRLDFTPDRLGGTTMTITATDPAGNAISQTFTVDIDPVFASGIVGTNVNVIGPTPVGPDRYADLDLRQQNEVECAIRPDNVQHMFCQFNDYRGADDEENVGDSWMGVSMTRDQGMTWRSELAPGYKGHSAPLTRELDDGTLVTGGFAADPAVVPVPGAMITAFIASDRSAKGPGGVYLQRWFETNAESGPPWQPQRDTLQVAKGSSLRFLDKLDLAVALDPAGGTVDVPTHLRDKAEAEVRPLPKATLYTAYTQFNTAPSGSTASDGFDFVPGEDPLAGWTVVADAGVVSPVFGPEASAGDGAIKIEPGATGVSLATPANFDFGPGEAVVASGFDFRIGPNDFTRGTPGIWVADFGMVSVELSGQTGTLRYGDGQIDTFEIVNDAWYRLEVRADFSEDAQTADVFVNGRLFAAGVPFSQARSGFSGIEFRHAPGQATGDSLWLDEVSADARTDAAAEIYVVSSDDYGETWRHEGPGCAVGDADCPPISDGSALNQGVSLAVLGDKVIAIWRRFASALGGQTNAIMYSIRDPQSGWSTAQVLAEMCPFDQVAGNTTFRSNAFAKAVSDGEDAYVFWSDRAFAARNVAEGMDSATRCANGFGRVVMSVLPQGGAWTPPVALDDSQSLLGHQFMPDASISGGRVQIAWYDTRHDEADLFTREVRDAFDGSGRRLKHTIDVRAARVVDYIPRPSIQVTQFRLGTEDGATITKLERSHPNARIFRKGRTPFIGDYISVAGPQYSLDPAGVWRQHGPQPQEPSFFVAWADNRDVRGDVWQDFVEPTKFSPGSPGPAASEPDPEPQEHLQCVPNTEEDLSLSRDQNIYGAMINPGLRLSSPTAFKPTDSLQRGFVVYLQNFTGTPRSYLLNIANQPTAGRASFSEFPRPPYSGDEAPPVVSEALTLPARSAAARMVFISSSDPGDPNPPVEVRVTETNCQSCQTSSLTLNANNPTAPAFDEPDDILSREVSNPTLAQNIQIREVSAPGLQNPGLQNPGLQNPGLQNPGLQNPGLQNPGLQNPGLQNPGLQNPGLQNIDIDASGLQNPGLQNPGLQNPGLQNPGLQNFVFENPGLQNPGLQNPGLQNVSFDASSLFNPGLQNATLADEPITGFTDVSWRVTNEGSASGSFALRPFLSGASADTTSQLIVTKAYAVPTVRDCNAENLVNYQVVTQVANPALDGNSGDAGRIYIEPGESVVVTLRVFEVARQDDPAATEPPLPGEPPATPQDEPPPPAPEDAGIFVFDETCDELAGEVCDEESPQPPPLVAGTPPPSPPPVAVIGVSANPVCANETIQLFGTGSFDQDEFGPAPSIVDYQWDFGDGSAQASGVGQAHVYASPGEYPVTLTVTDNDTLTGAQTGSATVPVTVLPLTDPACNQPPVAQCDAVTAAADQSCQAHASIDAGSFDPEGGDLLLRQSPPAPYILGQTPVTLNVTDPLGALASCSATVTVADRTPPLLSAPPDVVEECSSPDGQAVLLGEPTLLDNCGASVANQAPGLFRLGETTVTWTAMDVGGNSVIASQQVSIRDTVAPVPDLPSLPEVNGECEARVPAAPTATDRCEAGIAGTATDPLFYDSQGVFSVDWSYADSSGNTSHQNQQVVVRDVTPPAIQCGSPANIVPPGVPVSFTATATDNCSGATVAVLSYDCHKINGAGKRVDKTDACVVSLMGDTVTIRESGGVGDVISWVVRATDIGGNSTDAVCTVEVANPGKGEGPGSGNGASNKTRRK